VNDRAALSVVVQSTSEEWQVEVLLLGDHLAGPAQLCGKALGFTWFGEQARCLCVNPAGGGDENQC
jgi:hypothetical protein